MDRRKFIKTSGALCGLSLIGSAMLIESCKKSSPADTTPQGPTVNFTLDLSLAANSALNTAGGAVSSNGVIVVNDAGTYLAVAQACTHAGCSVGFNAGNHSFICPCHGGTFDNSGNVTSGPPTVALKKYTVTKNGHILTVAG